MISTSANAKIKAHAAWDRGDLLEAQRLCEGIARSAPDDADVQLALGWLKRDGEDWRSAREAAGEVE